MTRTLDCKSLIGGMIVGAGLGFVIGYLSCLVQLEPVTTLEVPGGMQVEPLRTEVDLGRHNVLLTHFSLAKASNAAAHLMPLLEKLAVGMKAGTATVAMISEAQTANAKLVASIKPLADVGIPGTGENGPFTHPCIAAAMIAATLERLGAPMRKDQLVRLSGIGVSFALEDESRLQEYGPEESAFFRTAEEGRLKERFYAECDGVLTGEQQSLLHGTVARDRCGVDLFSAALFWGALVVPVEYRNKEEFSHAIVLKLGQDLGAQNKHRLAKTVDRWLDTLPASFLAPVKDVLTENRLTSLARVREAVEHQLNLLVELRKEFGGSAPLSPADEFLLLPVRL